MSRPDDGLEEEAERALGAAHLNAGEVGGHERLFGRVGMVLEKRPQEMDGFFVLDGRGRGRGGGGVGGGGVFFEDFLDLVKHCIERGEGGAEVEAAG